MPMNSRSILGCDILNVERTIDQDPIGEFKIDFSNVP